MTIRRKSRWRSENLRRHLRNRANQRAAKERIRRARLARPAPMPDTSHVVVPRCRPSGFRVSFTAHRGPWGLTVSPTLAGRKVATILREYRPA